MGMKIELDLEDILGGDDSGQETLQESIRRQVIDALTNSLKETIQRAIRNKIDETIETELHAQLVERMPSIMDIIMNEPYKPVSRYGQSSEPTTFKAELVKEVHSQLVYKKTSSSYDRNLFTKAVDDTVEENLRQFKADFNKKVDQDYTAACMEYARQKLMDKLGIK
jgi:FKBP-type peptidyl-prolyl cis-trans isomerase (trigger factor)